MAHWSDLLKQSYHSIDQLKELLCLSDEEVRSLTSVQEHYPVFINPYYLSLVDPGDPDDPIRKMCVPSAAELEAAGRADTSGEESNTVLPGVQHKYTQTALLLTTNQCAMCCRHCFRRRMVGVENEETITDIPQAVHYVRDHGEINNVLVSGGDSFLNSNETIETYLSLLCEIDHLDFIRFGTRTPVVLPQRITEDDELKEILQKYAGIKQLYVITQFNHPREITPESSLAIRELTSMGIPVRNQAVLLKGVNDDPDVLSDLLQGLTKIGVIPYYIFQCRPVIGVMNHFQVPLRTGYKIIEQTMNRQSGPAKHFRYIMSREPGKAEILGMRDEDTMLFKSHQAKDEADKGRIFEEKIAEDQCWLE